MPSSVQARDRREAAARRLLQALGARPGTTVVGVIAFLTFFSWFSEVFRRVVLWVMAAGERPAMQEILLGLAFPVLTLILALLARRDVDLAFDVDQESVPAKVRALILFLSPPGQDLALVHELLQSNRAVSIGEHAVRARFGGPWRMPLEAIAYHRDRLESVVVIASRPAMRQDGSVDPGSESHLDGFCALISRVCGQSLEIAGLKHDDGRVWAPDSEDLKELVGAVETAHATLRRRLPDAEILIDITGGKKISSAAGTVVSLAKDRRIQYVSTSDFVVRVYNLIPIDPHGD